MCVNRVSIQQNPTSGGRVLFQEFYKDWWNATNLGEYWRLWNIPVHRWMLRTVYYPALSYGVGRDVAMLLVFFVSAVFHEIAVAVPLKLTRNFPWSFVGILGQVRLWISLGYICITSNTSWGSITEFRNDSCSERIGTDYVQNMLDTKYI